MNKKILAMMLAGITVMACVACSDAENKKGKDVETEVSIEDPRFNLIEKEYPVSFKNAETEEVYVEGVVRKPSLVSFERVNSNVSKTINSVLSKAYDRNSSGANNLMDQVVQAFDDESFVPENGGFPWSFTTDYDIIRNDGKVVTVKETVEYVVGNENVVSSYYYNFDVNDGSQIMNIFFVEGDNDERDAIDLVVFEKLKEKYGADNVNYDNVYSSFVEIATDSWYFTENGVNVYFNRYEIAPESEVDFEIELTRDELPEFAQEYFLD